MHTQP